MNGLDFYKKCPYYVQNALLNAYALRLKSKREGPAFWRTLTQLRQTEHFSDTQIREYQNTRLRELIEHAYTTVPFYRKRMRELDIHPSDIAGIDDLHKMPILEKDDIRNNMESILSSAFDRSTITLGSTSGTTGSPLTVAWDRRLQIMNHAIDWRQKAWAGVNVRDPIALLLGRPIVAPDRSRPPFWQLNHVNNQLWMSAFHMNHVHLGSYLLALRRFRPVAIEGYPSTVHELAQYMLNFGEELKGIKAVFTSSEPLTDAQRADIEKAFAAPLYDFYGHAERAIFATQCEARSGYHVNHEYGVLELVDSTDHPVQDDNVGSMIGTSLWNFAMPIIRYRVGDETSLISQRCECGRQMQRISGVDTKHEDRIICPDGTVISASALTHPFKPIRTIERSQIVQTSANTIEIRIVRRPNYSDDDEHRLLSEFRYRVGPSIDVQVCYVPEIPRTASGKYRWVINRMTRARTGTDS